MLDDDRTLRGVARANAARYEACLLSAPSRRPNPAVSPHRSVPPPDACLRAAATCPRRRAQEAINVLLFLGVDSHKDSLAICLVDQTGAQLAAATFPNTPDGHGDLLAWRSEERRVGKECRSRWSPYH